LLTWLRLRGVFVCVGGLALSAPMLHPATKHS
jgi:hypothetical protein